jgi:hypothetical protein
MSEPTYPAADQPAADEAAAPEQDTEHGHADETADTDHSADDAAPVEDDAA